MEDIDNELEVRRREDLENCFTLRIFVKSFGSYRIMKRNDYLGVMLDERVVIPTIYDDVSIYPSKDGILIAVVKINDLCGCYILREAQARELMAPSMSDILVSPFYSGVILKSESGEGLLDIKRGKIVFAPEYKCVSHETDIRCVWAETHSGEHVFFNTLTGLRHVIQENVIPLEHKDLALAMHEDGMIEIIEGTELDLRKIVMNEGGRFAFENSRISRYFVSDPEGWILNA